MKNSKLFHVLAFSMVFGFGDLNTSIASTLSEYQSNQVKISGVVKDVNGPISGASIAVKGTSITTFSDASGRFSLATIPAGSKIVISYVGYASKEIEWKGESTLNVQLESTSNDLDEVVVVAYGTAKKSTFTGSASVVKSDQLEKISGSGFAEALQGMSPGVNVVNNEGNPGGDTRIQIRGISSMSGNSNPLYVVDGMPYDGQLNSISPSDIESVTVLKDAAASSLYGSRAANGVVVVTTKKGKTAKPQLNFRSAWGTSDNAVKNPTKASPQEQLLNTWEAMYNDQFYKYNLTSDKAGDWASENVLSKLLKKVKNSKGEETYISPFQHINEDYVLHDGKGNPYINPNLKMVWNEEDYDVYKAVFSRKLRQDYGMDVSGTAGDGKTNYFLSSSYLDDKGYASNQYFKRYGFRANVTTQINKWLQVGGNVSYSGSRQNVSGAARALVFTTSMYSPYLRNRDNTDWVYSEKTGKRMYDYGDYVNNFFGANVLQNNGDYWNNDNDEDFNNFMRTMIASRFFAQVTLPYNLSFKTSLSIDDNSSKNFLYGSAVHGAGQLAPYGVTVLTNGGNATRSNTNTKSVTFNNILSWNQDFGNHNFSALAGQESYTNNSLYDYGYGEGIMQLGQYELSSSTKNWQVQSNKDRFALLSYFGKLDYNYNSKYYLSGSFRRDGSSRFHPDNRWGNFFSAGLSWQIAKEDFLKDVSWLDNLSFRSSYGTTGNDKLSRRGANGVGGGDIYYAYQGVYEANDLYGQAGLRPSAFATPALIWEKNKQFNAAFDFSIFKNIYGTIEYYSRTASDLLYYKEFPLSAQVGNANGLNTNLGDLKNSGFEFSLGADAIRTENFRWKIDANLSTLKNEITYLPGGEFTYNNRGAGYKLSEGYSLYEFYMVKNAGVNPETGNMRYWIRDGENWKMTENYDKDVTSNDYQRIGSALPKVYGSLTNAFNYKGLDMSFMLYYSLGSKMFDYAYVERTAVRGGVGVIQDLVEDHWRKPGDQALLPKFSNDDYASTRKNSDFYVFDNDYLRLRNVSLGYTLPTATMARLGLSKVRLYVSGDNLLTFGSAKNRYSDPETALSGNNYNGSADKDNGIQGSRRVYMAGLQVSF